MPETLISPARRSRLQYLLGASLVFFGAVCFSAKAVLIKYAYNHYKIDSVSLLCLRMVFAFPFYAGVAFYLSRKENYIKLKQKQWLVLALLGIVGYYVSSILDFEGLNYVTASVERLILFIYPTLVVVFSALFFRKKIKLIQYLALALTYTGMLIAFIPDLKAGINNNLLIGATWIFISAVTYACYMIGSGEMIPALGSLKFTSFAMMFATLAILIHFCLINGFNLFHFPAGVYWISIAMAIFSTVLPTFAVSEGIRMIGSGNASIIGGIGPVSTIVLANIYLGEAISVQQLAGTFVVLAGVLMISWKGKK
jgi:drug/metabolite transporter (DMT)-like permease